MSDTNTHSHTWWEWLDVVASYGYAAHDIRNKSSSSSRSKQKQQPINTAPHTGLKCTERERGGEIGKERERESENIEVNIYDKLCAVWCAHNPMNNLALDLFSSSFASLHCFWFCRVSLSFAWDFYQCSTYTERKERDREIRNGTHVRGIHSTCWFCIIFFCFVYHKWWLTYAREIKAKKVARMCTENAEEDEGRKMYSNIIWFPSGPHFNYKFDNSNWISNKW